MSWYRRAAKALSASEQRKAETEEGIELYKGGARAHGAMKVALSHGAGDFLAGGVLYALVTSDGFKKLDFVKKYWWALPLLVCIAGWALYRKLPWIGGAILGVGAGLFYQAYKDQDAKDKLAKNAANPAAAKPDGAGVGDDAGWPWERRRWESHRARRRVRAGGRAGGGARLALRR